VSTTRSSFIDHVRIVLTALVVLHHTALMYGGSGGWYWREEPNASNLTLLVFNATNQSFFMGFFFLLAGYFTPAALQRKGEAAFVRDRLLRLGLPLLFYFFALHPLTIALAHFGDGAAFWPEWRDMMLERDFGPGPLWFAEALLLFAAAFLLWRRVHPAYPVHSATAPLAANLPGFGMLFRTAIALGLLSFGVRLVIPVGDEVLWLQLGYFPCYIWLFFAGCAAAQGRVLENISARSALPWLLFTLPGIAFIPWLVQTRSELGSFDGGWNLNALIYALWDPLVGGGVILCALWAARTWWSRTNAVLQWLARSAYAAFILHPPIVVALGVVARSWTAAPLGKFLVVGVLAVAVSFVCGGLLCRLPGTRRIV
jgi:fucose 4-O-acetylase-like acetyltransferase